MRSAGRTRTVRGHTVAQPASRLRAVCERCVRPRAVASCCKPWGGLLGVVADINPEGHSRRMLSTRRTSATHRPGAAPKRRVCPRSPASSFSYVNFLLCAFATPSVAAPASGRLRCPPHGPCFVFHVQAPFSARNCKACTCTALHPARAQMPPRRRTSVPSALAPDPVSS